MLVTQMAFNVSGRKFLTFDSAGKIKVDEIQWDKLDQFLDGSLRLHLQLLKHYGVD